MRRYVDVEIAPQLRRQGLRDDEVAGVATGDEHGGVRAEESRERVMKMPMPDFRKLDERVDEPLNEILQRCLTRDLDQRYATADELMTALEY